MGVRKLGTSVALIHLILHVQSLPERKQRNHASRKRDTFSFLRILEDNSHLRLLEVGNDSPSERQENGGSRVVGASSRELGFLLQLVFCVL